MKPLVRQPMPEPTPPHLKEMINIITVAMMRMMVSVTVQPVKRPYKICKVKIKTL